MDALQGIEHYLGQVRRRRTLLHLVRDTLIFVGAASVGLLALLLIASAVQAQDLLRALTLLLGISAASGFALYLAQTLRRLSRPDALARLVGRQRPELYSDLLSTVELALAPSVGAEARSRPSAPCSPALLRALAAQTARSLQARPAEALVPPRLLVPAGLCLAAALLIWGAAALISPRRVQLGAAVLLPGGAGVPAMEADEPLVEDLSLRLTYPRHMGRAPRRVVGATGHIAAPLGTRVTLSARPTLPAREAVLRLKQGEDAEEPRRLPMTRGKGGILQATLTVEGAGWYRVELTEPGGRRLLDPVVRRVEVKPDTFPTVVLYAPDDGKEVTPRHRVEIGFTAADDYGLAEVDLVFAASGDEERRLPWWRPGDEARPRRAVGKKEWDLAPLDLSAGVVITYWLEAKDNDRVSGPKVGRSAVRALSIASADDKHRATLALQERVLEQSVRALADRLLLFTEQDPAPVAASLLARAAAAHSTDQRLLDGLRELRNRMRLDPLVPPADARTVSREHQALRRVMRGEERLLRPLERRGELREAHLAPLRSHNATVVQRLERATLVLADLLDQLRLQGLAQIQRRLEEGAKRLAELMERYRKAPSEALRREILRQVQQLRRGLAQLQAQAARLQGRIPDEYLNAEALKGKDPTHSLERLAQKLQQNDLAGAEAALQQLQAALGEMDQLLDGNLRDLRNARMGEREKAYSELLDALRGLEEEQRKLAGQSDELLRAYRKRAAELMKRRVEPQLRRAAARVEELARRVDEIDQSALPSYDQEQLQRIRQRVRDLRGMLEQADVDQALRMAGRAHNALRVLEDDLYEEVEGRYALSRNRARRTLGKTRKARKLAGEIARGLEALFPRPGSMLDGEQRRKLRRMQQQQLALQRRAGQFLAPEQQGKGQGQGGEPSPSPFLGEGARKRLSEAAGMMGRAGARLRETRLQQAEGLQKGAAAKLAEARRQVKGSRSARLNRGNGASPLREKVRIPGAEAFQPPREFRRDLLEAMKEQPPEAYREQVKRYYEELVQ